MNNLEIKDIMVGDEAAAVRSLLQVSYPMENGMALDLGINLLLDATTRLLISSNWN